MVIEKVNTSTITGVAAATVQVEVSLDAGEKSFNIIGMADTAVKEAKDRVGHALKSSGYNLPGSILVNLSPAEIKKEGSAFDLAIAIGILVASGVLSREVVHNRSFHGELGLDARVQSIKGSVAFAVHAAAIGIKELFVPYQNFQEACIVKSVKVTPIRSLNDLVYYLKGELEIDPPEDAELSTEDSQSNSLLEVHGQLEAKRALVIAAAGGHNVLFIGPPGCGKSMMAERFPSLLPSLSSNDRLELAQLYSVAGLNVSPIIQGKRPFRSPHHVVSEAGLVGGGSRPRPGEITLAHHGVLFLDEFPEFKRGVLEALRAPLEARKVRVTRAKGSVVFPANFQLIAAMNPCPCGRLGVKEMQCICSRTSVLNYLKKLSQPILDRIDLHVDLEMVPLDELRKNKLEVSESDLRELQVKVAKARDLAINRSGKLNSMLANKELKEVLNINTAAEKLLDKLSSTKDMSARGYFRMLKVARTAADLEQSPGVEPVHIAEAARFRSLERLKSYCSQG